MVMRCGVLAVVALAAACERGGASARRPAPRPGMTWHRGDDPRVRIEGRAASGPGGPSFAWPASTVHLRFRGSTLDLRLRDTLLDDRIRDADALGVVVDGGPMGRLALREGEAVYRVAQGLPPGAHDVDLVKLTEPEAGAITLLGVGVDGALEPGAPPRSRRLLAIGDSITAGYGIAGPAGCHYSADYADASRAWATLAARALGAEVQVLAWSGRGVLWNNNPEAEGLMPGLMERALPADPASTWDWQAFVPDAVVVNLGTNDVSRPEYDADAFGRAYGEILDGLRGRFPRARLVVALGPLIADDDPAPGTGRLTRMRDTLQGLVRARQQRGDGAVRFLELYSGDPAAEGYGCDQHPSVATHARLAAALAGELADLAPARPQDTAIAHRSAAP
ncbi:MAG: GDSL-type esterase/lipase family protein [Myxococcales bacterium]|nr:GDSL-type esterase/lipase family protein [Myxococcales bacterium]